MPWFHARPRRHAGRPLPWEWPEMVATRPRGSGDPRACGGAPAALWHAHSPLSLLPLPILFSPSDPSPERAVRAAQTLTSATI
eukprot:3235883-Pyramimonas_sp.AAC.1